MVERLFESIEHKASLGRSRHPPADDAAGEGIDDEGDVDKPLPGRDIGEVRHPQRIRPRYPENWRFTLSRGQGAAGLPIVVFIALPRIMRPTAPSVASAGRSCSAPPRSLRGFELPPDLAHAVDPEIPLPDPADLGSQDRVPPPSGRQARGVSRRAAACS